MSNDQDDASEGAPAAGPGAREVKSATTSPDVVLSVAGLAKAYGSTQALRSCSLTLRTGQVHAVVGENGSGKSTMVKLVTGVAQPDRGTIDTGGVVRASFRNPREAMAEGIFGVFQNMMVVPSRSVLDNIWLGPDGIFARPIPGEERRSRGAEILRELLGRVPNLNAEASTLQLSEIQALGIARALIRQPKVLILDEATSALDIETRDRLFVILKAIASAGTASLFISHRMDEIEEIGDVITVMRAGQTVATVNRGDRSTSEIVTMMAGEERAAAERSAARRGAAVHASRAVISTRDLVLESGSPPINERILEGELVGVAGLEGHGQERFLQVLAGARPASGAVIMDDDKIVRSRQHGYSLGIVYVPRDRQTAGIFESLSINDNFAAGTVAEDRQFGLLSRARTRARLTGYIDSLKIKLADPSDAISTLSGGNQQKVVVARWLAAKPRVMLLDDPARGIDPGARQDLYDLLASLTNDGMTVIMASTDVDELVELADRVIVFREGTVYAELGHDGLTRNALVSSFFGR
jgi:ABC-type sugar transport system ATPase subunit